MSQGYSPLGSKYKPHKILKLLILSLAVKASFKLQEPNLKIFKGVAGIKNLNAAIQKQLQQDKLV